MVKFDKSKIIPTYKQAVTHGFHKWHQDNPDRGGGICLMCTYQHDQADRHETEPCGGCVVLVDGKHCGDIKHPFTMWCNSYKDSADRTKHADEIFKIFKREMERIK